MLDLGGLWREGGFLVHYLIGVAIEGTACGAIWKARQELDRDARSFLIAHMQAALDDAEPLEAMLHRERVWCEHAYMPYYRLSTMLGDLIGENWSIRMSRENAYPRRAAQIGLVLCELAVASYREANGRLPTSLEQLAPDYLPSVPLDPFDPAGGPLRYRLTGDGHLLYSVGPNGRDDDGEWIPDKDSPGIPEQGDYRLDQLWAP
jgi:hypothetical protein